MTEEEVSIEKFIETFTWENFIKMGVLERPNHWTMAFLAKEIFKGRIRYYPSSDKWSVIIINDGGISDIHQNFITFLVSKHLQSLVDRFLLEKEVSYKEKLERIKDLLSDVKFVVEMLKFFGPMLRSN